MLKSTKYKFARHNKFKLKFRGKVIDFLFNGTAESRHNNEINILKAKLLTRFQIKILFIHTICADQ